MKNLFGLIVLGFVVTTGVAQVSPVDQHATIWFYRPADSPQAKNIPTLHEVAGLTRPLGRLAPGEFFGYSVSPGTYVFSYTRAPARGQDLSVLVKPGEQAYVEVHFRDLRQVPVARGAAAMRRLRPAPDVNVLDRSVILAPGSSATPAQVSAPLPDGQSPVPPLNGPTINVWPTVASATSKNATSATGTVPPPATTAVAETTTVSTTTDTAPPPVTTAAAETTTAPTITATTPPPSITAAAETAPAPTITATTPPPSTTAAAETAPAPTITATTPPPSITAAAETAPAPTITATTPPPATTADAKAAATLTTTATPETAPAPTPTTIPTALATTAAAERPPAPTTTDTTPPAATTAAAETTATPTTAETILAPEGVTGPVRDATTTSRPAGSNTVRTPSPSSSTAASKSPTPAAASPSSIHASSAPSSEPDTSTMRTSTAAASTTAPTSTGTPPVTAAVDAVEVNSAGASPAASDSLPSAEIQAALSRAQKLYFAAEFQESILVLGPLDLALKDQPGRIPEAVKVKLQLALAHMGLDETDVAQMRFEELCRLDPVYVLDSFQYAPKVISLFTKARDAATQSRCSAACTQARMFLNEANLHALLASDRKSTRLNSSH